MSDKARNRGSKKKIQDKEMPYEQKLERENELLRLEVEYLKKLQAFQMKYATNLRIGPKTSRGSFRNCKRIKVQ
ncbi:MAG TPA: hypothetical protein VEY70_11555, partial [Metabacillus sp.]|nr:hypothetical protein [Metabacillus sp.]